LFELGTAKKVDFEFAGPQSLRVAQLLEDGVVETGAIHTYIGGVGVRSGLCRASSAGKFVLRFNYDKLDTIYGKHTRNSCER
jgi:hypothetical protein